MGAHLQARGKAAAGPAPEGPGTALLARLQIAAEDDRGTAYTLRAGNTGGSGSERHGDWFLTADVPYEARHLTVTVTSPTGEAATVGLDVSAAG